MIFDRNLPEFTHMEENGRPKGSYWPWPVSSHGESIYGHVSSNRGLDPNRPINQKQIGGMSSLTVEEDMLNLRLAYCC